jgi:NADH-quinone oxidoreductase subunit E
VTCWIKGYEKLEQQIGDHLGVSLGETTADNQYTFLPVTCLGACDKAPVMMVGDDLYENIDASDLSTIFRSAKEAQA